MRYLLALLMLLSAPVFGDEVTSELQRRSNTPVQELNELLKDCQNTQLSMNICSFRNVIKTDLEIKKIRNEKLKSLPESCRAKFLKQEGDWEESRDELCNKEADEEAQGGSMRPMIFTSCQTVPTEKRILKLETITGWSSLD